MSTSLHNLFIEMGKMDIPTGYSVSFTFRGGNTEYIKLAVTGPDDIRATSWTISKKELETHKLDFIKDNIDDMIEHLKEMYKED